MQENAKKEGVFYKIFATILLIIPWIAYLWITTYDKAQPTLFGITFFYWSDLLPALEEARVP